jgi:NAD(P) transhydrogenase subunit alpha
MTSVFIPRERAAGESRVAATPETVRAMIKAGFAVTVEQDAGEGAHIDDAAYEAAGAKITSEAVWGDGEVILKVAPPSMDEAKSIREGALLLGFIAPHRNLEAVAALASRRANVLAMELIPRVTRAQTMDALSSQASVAGYKAIILAAAKLGKYFPLLMTAAGTVTPARVVILGAGVAGLQALATAKRLGAVVEVHDVRAAVKEQVESLGGRFIDVTIGESGEGEGGYARELSAETLAKQREVLASHLRHADVIVTTAAIPGKKAPILVDAATVQRMRRGAVIVDLAVESGGNCELSEPDREVVRHGVTIMGHANLASMMAEDASVLYARNVLALLKHVSRDGSISIDRNDEIVQGALLTSGGEIHHQPTADALKGDPAWAHS